MAEIIYAGRLGTDDPLRKFRFQVLVGDYEFKFSRIGPLNFGVEPIGYNDGGGLVPRQVPGKVIYNPITAIHGVTEGDDMWDWCEHVFNLNEEYGNPAFRVSAITINLLHYYKAAGANVEADSIAKTWQAIDVWISNYEIDQLDRDANELLLASVVFQHEGLKQVPTGVGTNDLEAGG